MKQGDKGSICYQSLQISLTEQTTDISANLFEVHSLKVLWRRGVIL